MTWRNNLRPASFRGVSFEVEDHEFTTGRRGQQHQYAKRDKSYWEDLGLRAGEYAVQAFIVGDDYMQRRDALVKACQQEGPGTLVHPYLGSIQVACSTCKVVERVSEGRMCRVQLTFEDAGENAFPGGGRDHGYTINRSADTAGSLVVEDFGQRFDLSGLPDFVTTDALAALEEAASLANGLSGGFNTTRAVDALLALGPAELQDGALVGRRVLSLAQAFNLDFDGQPNRTAYAARSFSQYSTASRVANVPVTTSTRVRQVEALNLLGSLITRVGLIEEGRTFADREFDSYQAAIAGAQDYAGRVEESHSMPGGISDDVYQGMVQVQADVVGYVSDQAAGLPQLRQVTLPTQRPALVASYEIYGDARQDADIVKRNGVRDPGAVPGGVPLEVLQQ